VKTDWLIKCIRNKTYYPWTPSDMIHCTEKTREYFSQIFDKYGDNYFEETDCEQLKLIFSNISPADMESDEDIHYKIAFIENKYFPDESAEYGLFRLSNFYLDLYKKLNNNSEEYLIVNSSLDLTKLKLMWYGGVISQQIDDSTSHCVLDKKYALF
jgi:DNA ligase-4